MTTNTNPKVYSSSEKLLLKILGSLHRGTMTLVTPDGETFRFRGKHAGVEAHLKINDWKMIDALISRGDIGFGEAYRDGLWDSSDISKVVHLAIQNEKALKKVIVGSALSLVPYLVKHKLNKNTEKGSKRNIEAHYDLGNDFYSLWLDETMTYSSAYFKGDEDLKEAQKNKYNQIIKKLGDLPAGSHILEVGCGWGGFMNAAKERDWKVKGLTLSKEQKSYVDLAVGPGATLQDYRKENGKYDALVSIEMFEALGKEYWKTYFKKLSSVLKVGAPAVIQTITMNEGDFKAYQKGTDFIQQYIFPGGMLPSVEAFTKLAMKEGFKVVHSESFGKSYAKTLKVWEQNFSSKLDEVKALGFDDAFLRLWKFYLKYCEGAFESAKINVYQFHLEKA